MELDLEVNYQVHNISVINNLKQKMKLLDTDLMRFELLSNCYQKYFDYFNEKNYSNNKVLDLSEKIQSLNDLKNNLKFLKECEKSCFVSLEKLDTNQLKGEL